MWPDLHYTASWGALHKMIGRLDDQGLNHSRFTTPLFTSRAEDIKNADSYLQFSNLPGKNWDDPTPKRDQTLVEGHLGNQHTRQEDHRTVQRGQNWQFTTPLSQWIQFNWQPLTKTKERYQIEAQQPLNLFTYLAKVDTNLYLGLNIHEIAFKLIKSNISSCNFLTFEHWWPYWLLLVHAINWVTGYQLPKIQQIFNF